MYYVHLIDCRNDAQTSVGPMKTVVSHERMTGSSEDMPLNGTRDKVEKDIQHFLLLQVILNPSLFSSL